MGNTHTVILSLILWSLRSFHQNKWRLNLLDKDGWKLDLLGREIYSLGALGLRIALLLDSKFIFRTI